jgi:hypothetical protein
MRLTLKSLSLGRLQHLICRRCIMLQTFISLARLKAVLFSLTPLLKISARSVLHLCRRCCTTRTPEISVQCILHWLILISCIQPLFPKLFFLRRCLLRTSAIPRTFSRLCLLNMSTNGVIRRIKVSSITTVAAVRLPSGARPLPWLWVFTRKRDGTPKARFCVGGHRQIMGRDYFPNKIY